jgi:cobalt transporter subunit CbtB
MSIRVGSTTYPLPLSERAVASLLVLLGVVGLLVLGFAPGTLLHEFVHDGRHLLAFPCH